MLGGLGVRQPICASRNQPDCLQKVDEGLRIGVAVLMYEPLVLCEIGVACTIQIMLSAARRDPMAGQCTCAGIPRMKGLELGVGGVSEVGL